MKPWIFKRPDEVTTRFISVIAIFVIIGICVLSLDRLQARILTSVRAYVAGEGFYSKAQKDAVNHLLRYAASRNESEYDEFLTEIEVPIADRKARLALQASPPNLIEARKEFLRGRNNPEDVEHLIWLFVNFHNYADMKQAITIWTQADRTVETLLRLGRQLHRDVTSGNGSSRTLNRVLDRVEANNSALASLENNFSITLGITANRIDHITGILIIVATLTLLTLGIVLSSQIVQRVRSAQSLLLESEARFRQVVESNIIGIMFWQGDGTIYDANDAFLNLIGYERSDLGKFTWADITPGDVAARDQRAREEIFATGSCEPYETEFLRKDSSTVSVLLGAALLEGQQGTGLCFVLDISELRRLQERIAQSQRMEAIGTLVGGLAHDFNNTLSAMLGNIHLARLETVEHSAVGTHLDNMEVLSSHSVRIVQQLMAFARKNVSRMSPVSLNELIADVHEQATTNLPERIEFNTTITAEPLTVTGDEVQLRRVMQNLIDNARDAVAGTAGPRISCMLDRYRRDDSAPATSQLFETEMAHIIVRDNGCGMSDRTLAHVFEPFYTTKGIAEGSGLGMSTVYGIVQSHRGEIHIETGMDSGTHIHVYLPLSTGTQGGDFSETNELPPAHERAITILLVDDHADIRDLCRRFLEANGQSVLTAEDGAAALAVFEAHKEEIALLITDIVMPNMSGIQLAERVRLRHPYMPVIFMTGYDPEQAIPDQLDMHSRIITKPFSNVELVRCVDEVLAATHK